MNPTAHGEMEAAIERELGPRAQHLRQKEQIAETVDAALQVVELMIARETGVQPEDLELVSTSRRLKQKGN